MFKKIATATALFVALSAPVSAASFNECEDALGIATRMSIMAIEGDNAGIGALVNYLMDVEGYTETQIDGLVDITLAIIEMGVQGYSANQIYDIFMQVCLEV